MLDNYRVLINQAGSMTELFVPNESFQLEETVNDFRRCQFSAIDYDNRISTLRKGLRIEVYRADTLVFSGVLNTWTKKDVASDGITFYDLNVLGNEFILQKRVIRNDKDYSGLTVKQAVTAILADGAISSVTIGDIENNVVVDDLKNDYNYAFDLFNQIADITESYWWIDQYRKLYFVSSDEARPVDKQLDYDDVVGDRPFLKVANEKKITRVVFADYYEAGSSRYAKLYTDGNKRKFELDNPAYEIEAIKLRLNDGTFVRNIAFTKKKDLSEVDFEVVTDEDYEGDNFDYVSEVYWARGDKSIYQSNATSAQMFGFYFDIKYRPLLKKNYVYTDTAARDMMLSDSGATGNIDEIYEDTVYGRAEADSIARTIIKFNAKKSEEVTFDTLRKDLKAGDIVNLNLPEYGIVDRKYIVSNMTFVQESIDFVKCSLVLSRGVINRDWSTFFADKKGKRTPSKGTKKASDLTKPAYAGTDYNNRLGENDSPTLPDYGQGSGGGGGGEGGSFILEMRENDPPQNELEPGRIWFRVDLI